MPNKHTSTVNVLDVAFGCNVAEWLERRTWNLEVASSSPALATHLELSVNPSLI